MELLHKQQLWSNAQDQYKLTADEIPSMRSYSPTACSGTIAIWSSLWDVISGVISIT